MNYSEGLAFIYDINKSNQFLFLPTQPPGTTGLARRLNTEVAYCSLFGLTMKTIQRIRCCRSVR